MNEAHAYQVLGWILVDGQETEFEVYIDGENASSPENAKMVASCQYPGFHPMESYFIDLEG